MAVSGLGFWVWVMGLKAHVLEFRAQSSSAVSVETADSAVSVETVKLTQSFCSSGSSPQATW